MLMIASMQGLNDALMHVAGFLFVVFVLSLLWLVVELVGRIFRSIEQRKSASVAVATATPAPVSKNDDDVPEEDLVIIAATAALLLGAKPHRLVSIRTSSLDWSREGRRQHLQSHRVKG